MVVERRNQASGGVTLYQVERSERVGGKHQLDRPNFEGIVSGSIS